MQDPNMDIMFLWKILGQLTNNRNFEMKIWIKVAVGEIL